MKKVFLILTVILISASSLVLTSCSDDDTTPDRPTIVVPAGIQTVQVSTNKDLTFTIDIPGGFASYAIQESGGTFAVPSPMTIEEGDKSGSISGIFAAGDMPGAGAVTLTVTDMNGKSDTGSFILDIVE